MLVDEVRLRVDLLYSDRWWFFWEHFYFVAKWRWIGITPHSLWASLMAFFHHILSSNVKEKPLFLYRCCDAGVGNVFLHFRVSNPHSLSELSWGIQKNVTRKIGEVNSWEIILKAKMFKIIWFQFLNYRMEEFLMIYDIRSSFPSFCKKIPPREKKEGVDKEVLANKGFLSKYLPLWEELGGKETKKTWEIW